MLSRDVVRAEAFGDLLCEMIAHEFRVGPEVIGKEWHAFAQATAFVVYATGVEETAFSQVALEQAASKLP